MKEIFLQFSGRNKSVQIEPLPGQSDVSALCEKLVILCEKDRDLEARMQNSSIIFQRERSKSDGSKTMVDVEEDQDIPHESELRVIFAPFLTSIVPANIENSATLTPPSSSPETENKSTVEVVRLVPLQNQVQFLVSPECGSQPNFSSPPLSGDIQPNFISPPLNGVKSIPPSPASLPGSSRKRSTMKEISSPASRPFSLPPLTEHLKSLESVISSDSKPFIKFYGDAIRTWCDDAPTQADYDAVGRAIISRHASLADTTAPRPHGIVCSLLSQYVRNARSREKKAKNGLENSDDKSTVKPPPSKRLKFSLPESESNGLTDEDMKMMDAELGKLDAVGDTPHVRRLMKDSYPLRLRWISSASESARPSDILARFPHLKNVELALTPLGNDLSSNQNEGARLVVYIADNTIAVAFIIADDTQFKIESPSVEKCMLALTAYYHGLDRTYPTAYKSFFSLFDEFIFKLKVSVPISYKCFKKNYLVDVM